MRPERKACNCCGRFLAPNLNRACGTSRAGWTRLDMDNASLHRLQRALLAERSVEQDVLTRRDRLVFDVLCLATVRSCQQGILAIASSHLERPRDETGEGDTGRFRWLSMVRVTPVTTSTDTSSRSREPFTAATIPVVVPSAGDVTCGEAPADSVRISPAITDNVTVPRRVTTERRWSGCIGEPAGRFEVLTPGLNV